MAQKNVLAEIITGIAMLIFTVVLIIRTFYFDESINYLPFILLAVFQLLVIALSVQILKNTWSTNIAILLLIYAIFMTYVTIFHPIRAIWLVFLPIFFMVFPLLRFFFSKSGKFPNTHFTLIALIYGTCIFFIFTIIILLPSSPQDKLPKQFLELVRAENKARNFSVPVNLSENYERMYEYRDHLGVPNSFLPEANKLTYLKLGELTINGPDTILVGKPILYSASLRLDSNYIEKGPGTLSFQVKSDDEFEFSRILHAQMAGIDLEILPSRDEPLSQITSLNEEIVWEWQVKATRRGSEQPITVQIFAAAQDELAGNSEHAILLVPNETKYIDVTQSTLEWWFSNKFVQNVVIALIGSSVIASVLGVLFVHFLNRDLDKKLKSVQESQKELEKKLHNQKREMDTNLDEFGEDQSEIKIILAKLWKRVDGSEIDQGIFKRDDH